MANISLDSTYQADLNRFVMMGVDSPRFKSDWISAVNKTINKINRGADLETRVTRITGTEGTMALDDAYDDVVQTGVTIYLIMAGQKLQKNETVDLRLLKLQFEDEIDDIRQNILNIAVEADSDDETSFAQLGALNA